MVPLRPDVDPRIGRASGESQGAYAVPLPDSPPRRTTRGYLASTRTLWKDEAARRCHSEYHAANPATNRETAPTINVICAISIISSV